MPSVDTNQRLLPTVTPRLVVRDGAKALRFYEAAFGAVLRGEPVAGPDGALIHAELLIGSSTVWITEDVGDSDAPAKSPPSLGGAVSAIMVTYWRDVDSAWERAVTAGAEILYPLADQHYGERGGRLRDPFGQQWMLSQSVE